MPGIDQGLKSGPVGPRSRSVDPPGLAFPLRCRRQGIGVFGFVKGGDQGTGPVEPAHQLGKGIAEQAGDAQGHIHPGAAQQLQRQHLQIHHAAGGAIPHRANPHQGQGLTDVLAAVAHRGRPPHAQGEVAQVVALALQVLLQQQIGAAASQVPGGLGGKPPQIHAVEIPPRGEHIGSPPAGGATGPGRDAAPGQTGEEGFPFGCGAGQQVGEELVPQGPQHGVVAAARSEWILGLGSLWQGNGSQGGSHFAPQQSQSHGFQQGDGIAAMAPSSRFGCSGHFRRAGRGQRVWGARVVMAIHAEIGPLSRCWLPWGWRRRDCPSRSGKVLQAPAVRLPQRSFLRVRPGVQLQAQILGERLGEPRQASLGGPREAQETFSELLGFRQGAVDVQAQPDLGFLQLTEVAVRDIEPVVI